MQKRQLAAIDVRPEVEAAFRAELARKMKGTVWMTGCQSWYQTPDGEVFLWPGGDVRLLVEDPPRRPLRLLADSRKRARCA